MRGAARAMTRGRVVALLLAFAACGAPAARETEADAAAPSIDLPSLAACGTCHQREYEEWAQSLHHGAWTNANVRSATNDFAMAECRACHSPMPVLVSGLGDRPEYRAFNREDGVHCLSCHGLDDGVAAARDLPDAPCRPRRDPRLQQAELCYPCHEPTHQAFTEYRTSVAFADGVRCADCHMPERDDGSGHSHGPHGGMNAEFVRKALRWSCAIEGGEVVVTLQNRTGHKFPGEIPSRAFVLAVDVAGAEPVRELLRRPYKGEDRADNRLTPDERRVLRYPLPAGTAPGDVRVRLLFQPLPLLPIEASFVLGDWRGA